MRSKKFILAVLVLIFILLSAAAGYGASPEETWRKFQDEYNRTSDDKSFEDWLKEHYPSEQMVPEDWEIPDSSDFEPDTGKKSGDKSGDVSPDNTVKWAQEPSQIAIALLTFAEMKTLDKILEDQNKMLKKWNSSEIEKARSKIIDRIKNARDILANSAAFSHYATDIDKMMKERFPEWKEKMTIEAMAQRINERQSKWKASLKSYLKSMNATTSHFKDEDLKMREELMKIVKKPEGQIQAIQAIGGYFDNISMMLGRNEEVIHGIMTTYVERKIDLRDERNDLQKAVQEAAVSLKNYGLENNKPKKSKKHKLGF